MARQQGGESEDDITRWEASTEVTRSRFKVMAVRTEKKMDSREIFRLAGFTE